MKSALAEVVTKELSNERLGDAMTPLIDAKLKEMLSQIKGALQPEKANRYGLTKGMIETFGASLKAMSEGTNSAGGYFVPEEIQSGIIRMVEDFGLVRKFSTKISMPKTDTLNLPRLTTSVTVSWPGENTAGTPSDPVLGNVVLAVKTLMGITAVSNELLQDSNTSITEMLMTLFAEAIAGEEDNQGLMGSGSPFTGVMNDASVNLVAPAAGNSTFTLCTTADNLRDMITQIKPWALTGAGYFMHRVVLALAQKIKDTTNNYIVTAPTQVVFSDVNGGSYGAAGLPAGYIWGYPVYLSEKLPSSTAVSTKYVIFGNLKFLYLGDRQEMKLEVSNAATIGGVNAFAANQSVVRVTERVALAVALPTAFAVLRTSAT